MIRETMLKRISDCLYVQPELVPDDFNITSEEESRNVLLNIVYKFGSGEFFRAKIPFRKTEISNRMNFRISIEMNPGDITKNEDKDIVGSDSLMSEISDWARRISADLKTTPAQRMLDNYQVRLDDLEKFAEQLPDTVATVEELDAIKSMLDNLATELKKEVTDLKIDNAEKKQRLDDIEKEIAFLKRRAESTTLKTFFKLFGTRAMRLMSDPSFPVLVENSKTAIALLTGIQTGA